VIGERLWSNKVGRIGGRIRTAAAFRKVFGKVLEV
jgi:hypothetical protein